MKISPYLFASLTVSLGLLACSTISGAEAAGEASSTSPRPALTVTIVRPQLIDWPRQLEADGGLFAWQEGVVAAETGGLRISELLVDIGDRVKKGQPLARLAQETVKAELEQQRANVAKAEAALEQARADARRARGVKDKGTLSEQQSAQYLIAEESAKATLAAAEAALRTIEIRLSQTTILAVDDGVIISRNASLGTVVQVGTELFRIIRQGRVEWRGELLAEQLRLIRPGQTARLHLPGDRIVEGKVRVVSPILDNIDRKGLVYVDLPVDTETRPGAFIHGEIFLEETQAVTLPSAAVVWNDGHSYLYEVAKEGTVHRHKVRVGRFQGEQAEIVEGADPSADYVSAGGGFLHDGDRVRVETTL